MLLERRGKRPSPHGSVRVAHTNTPRDDAAVGENREISSGAVLTAERVAAEKGGTLGTSKRPVLVGRRAFIYGCTFENRPSPAAGSPAHDGSVVGEASEARVDRDAAGDPAEILPPTGHGMSGPRRSHPAHRTWSSEGWAGTRRNGDTRDHWPAHADRRR